MNEGLIPRRYAKALYDVASERQQATRLYTLMGALLAAAGAQPELTRTLANPYIGAAMRRHRLPILAQNHRMGMAADIARAYIDCYRNERRIYPVTVTSAAPLAPEESKRLRDLIQTHIGDASMEYAERVDPDLIGGFAIDIASERLDASVRARLEQMRHNLLKKQ